LIFSPSRRGRDNTTKDTFENVREVPEVVINTVSYEMVQKMNMASAEVPRGVNEFEIAGLTMEKSDLVRPYRVRESAVHFECRVLQIIETGLQGGAGTLVICEVLRMHVNPSILEENGKIDPDKIDLVGRLGGDFYVRASGSALFELPKPD
jgi:flavin reductase (DIM6/NTAB) family NADH-FMN oxidoreductase RutF